MTKANRFFDVLRQSFNRWSLIRFAMERCFAKAARRFVSTLENDFCRLSKAMSI